MANTSENKVIQSAEELNEIFKHDETRKVIAGKLEMPRPGKGGKAIIILNSKGDDGSIGPVKVVKNSKFKDGNGVFMAVAEADHPEVELQMGLGESLKQSFDRLCNSEGWKLTELPGKIVQLNAAYYKKNKCSQCGGRGCVACENTGQSTVFSVTARHDLMSPTGNVKGKTKVF